MLCSQLFTHALLALSLTLATPQESWGMITAGGGGYAAQSKYIIELIYSLASV